MNKKMKTKLLPLGAALALALTTVPGQAADFTMKVAHVAATTQPLYTCVEVLKAHVERFSGGRIAVEHYPAGQLGNFRQSVEQVQLGTLELTNTTGGGISNIFGPIQAFDIPYLFRDDRVADKVMLDPILNARLQKDVLKATGNTVRLIGMSGDHGWRSFFTNVPVKKASDLKGVKVRTIESPITMELARSLGANPTPIPWQELYTSLATGIVHGTKNSLSDIVDMSFTDFLKHGVLDRHTYIIFFWWMNEPWLQSLPDDLKRVVMDGYYAMTTTCNGLIDALMLPKFKKWAKIGGKLHIPTEAEKATFLPGQKAVADWYVKKFGPDYFELIKEAVKRAEAEIEAENKAALQ
ncbi:MAG: TRAP transporter substrate-binding protein DctP [Hyphomicrobiaceae bacterium]